MYSLRRFGIILGLSTIKNILKGLDNPEKKIKFIHVAGSNGKGSIASALATILHLSGYHTGLYTSPHLVKFNERICINGKPVSDKNIVEAYRAVKSVHYGKREPTFFEFATAMAFYEFGKNNLDWAVIETGMGGRLDATNIVKPELSIITNISLEHQSYLGHTLIDIAKEKGGIIKKNTPVVTGVQQPEVIETLKRTAKLHFSDFYRFKDSFRVRRNKNGSFNYYGIENVWHNIHTGLTGNHQIDNAALVLAACEILNKAGAKLELENIKSGLVQNKWPGRLEVISDSPLIILDGAHNLIASRNLAKYLSENLNKKKTTLIIGILDDKPYKAMLKCLLPMCHRVIFTCPEIDRALSTKKLYKTAKNIHPNLSAIDNVEQAVIHAVKTSSPDEAVCIAGSLYVVGEAKEAFEKHPEILH